MSHLLLLLLFAELEVEGFDTDWEVEENHQGDHQGDGQGPSKSAGDGEVLTKDSSPKDFANPDANVSRNPADEADDKGGLLLQDPNKADDGQDEREQAEGNVQSIPLSQVPQPTCFWKWVGGTNP